MFTPAAFLDIPVAISGLRHPLKVNIALNATVGDLKRQVQRQLSAAEDPCQFIVLNDEVLSNSFPLRLVYSCFEKGCRKKCTRQSRKVLWVVFSSLFFKEISKNGKKFHGRMFASAKGKQQK